MKVIGDVSDKLDINTQTNQTLEQMAEAIFKSWFVDFDPVKAKMNGEQPEGMDEVTASLFPEERWSERQSSAKPMLDDLYDWLTSQKVIESSPLGKAIKYTLGQWPKLIRYIEDGHLSIDNNRAERAIKSLVIGRKNWLFANNPNGADASALLYSIIETTKANGLILYDYMVKCMKELAKPEPEINSLLPWNFSH
ncbi:hypothetical protein BOO33_18525 [Vibrio navarrensis]|nr:hypothetical protein [Vibrio navarrensis]